MERISSLTIDDCDDMLWTFFASIPPPNGAISIHGDRFPNLESLTLCEVRVPASIASLRSLTSLKLDYVPYASWNALLDALGSCPALECLVLDSPIAPFESIVPPIHAGQNIVELRHLRRLDLSNFDLDDVDFEYPSLSFLLAHLSLPRTVRIDISTDFGEYDEQDSNELSTLLAGIIPADKTALPVFSALQGVQVTIGSQHLELVASGRDEAQTSGPSSFTLSHAMHGRWNKGYLQEQIVNELPMVFPSSVLTLRILVQGEDDNYDTFGNNWSRLYSAFPHIEDLCLGGPDPLFFNFLRDIGPDTPSQHEPLPWPKLKSIRFEFTATEDGVPFPGSAAESEQVVRAITSSMCNRRDATSVERLQHLTLVFPQKEFWPMEIAKLQSTTQTLVVLHD
ncbi:hypothetical protein EVJ58_g7567 [Rhodofomes roseus]|uniref:Uncharacterized protein n=1 Tax=Rhodofomes roseus TaxID=34475 RepID=A0A4Y9Y6Y4_9APHY|nr:hypothetical protein EVJ58_g7567 [Rhodofomes roseus]